MDFKYFLVILCIIVTVHAKSVIRIVGGKHAPEGKYPYQAFMKLGESFQCGASILNERYVLTAAHCVSGVSSDKLTVIVGTNSRLHGGDVYEAVTYEIHENYSFPNPTAPINDIALVRLKKKISFNDKVQPVKLPTSNFNAESAILTGWGKVGFIKSYSDNLKELKLKIYDQDKCKVQWENYKNVKIIDSQICTITEKGEGSCLGDSGGPLVANGNVQIGIVSFGKPCGTGHPDVYTRVSEYIEWINAHTY